jgi:8-oxo-dGTP pyrophosphatase MutT (NUDIX family)
MSSIPFIKKQLEKSLDNPACLSTLANEDERVKQYLEMQRTSDQPQIIFREAAVLIPLVRNSDDSLSILLTQRSKELKHHAGEISFPGGRAEQYDESLQATAIRETHEEVGITPSQIRIIGELPSQNTISQFRVTPFVGDVSDDYSIKIDRGEVAQTLLVPWNFITDSKNHTLRTVSNQQRQYSFYDIQYNDFRIWGATARMLVNLSHIIHFRE